MEHVPVFADQYKTIGKFLIGYTVGNFFKYIPLAVNCIIEFPFTPYCSFGRCVCSGLSVFSDGCNAEGCGTGSNINQSDFSVVICILTVKVKNFPDQCTVY